MNAITIGLDIAKSVFQVHAEDAAGRSSSRSVCAARRWRRFSPSCRRRWSGIEACGSSHHWGRTLRAHGHEVRLIPAAYVKPFVRRNKTDARDAAAICAALSRPDMRFVAIKSVEQQAARGLERSRELLVKQHTQLMNCVRSQFAEFGIVAAQGRRGFAELTALLEADDATVPPVLVAALRALVQQIEALRTAIAALEQRIMAVAKDHPVMRRLAGIPGVGGITAHAIVAADRRRPAVRLGPRLRRLGGTDAKAAFERRQKARPGHQPAGRQPLAQAVRARRQHDHAQRQVPHRSRHGMAARHPGAPAGEGRGPGAGRQDRPHRLGDPGLGRDLAGPQPAVGIGESKSRKPRPFQVERPATPSDRHRQGAKGSDGTMVRTWVGTLRVVIAHQKRAAMLGTQPAQPIGASGRRPRRQTEYMTAPDQMPTPPKTPCPTGAVHT